MDKHTKRYFGDFHQHYHEGMDLGEAMDFIRNGADTAYLSKAIDDEFEGVEHDFLKMKLFEEMYKRRG